MVSKQVFLTKYVKAHYYIENIFFNKKIVGSNNLIITIKKVVELKRNKMKNEKIWR